MQMGDWRYGSTILDLRTRWWPASRPGRFPPGEIASDTHWIGGWSGPQIWPGHYGQEKISYPMTGIGTPVVRV
jgi:hypothetical protein